MKMAYKILTLMLVATMMFSTVIPAVTYAKEAKSVITAIDSAKTATPETMTNMAGKVLSILRTFAIISAVLILTVIGIKFIFGSPEKKSEYKETLIPLVVGIVIVVAATSLVSFVFEFFK